jgi:hypothetical protein
VRAAILAGDSAGEATMHLSAKGRSVALEVAFWLTDDGILSRRSLAEMTYSG